MKTTLLRQLILCGLLLLLGGCSASGLVAEDVDLALHDVSVISPNDVNTNPEIMHNLREEVLYEFSKAPQNFVNTVDAHLVLDVKQMPQDVTLAQSSNWQTRSVSGSGQLFDARSGRKLGEFDWRGREGKSILGGNLEPQEKSLASLAAGDVLVKIYGSTRANDYSDRRSRYVRIPYRTRLAMARNYSLNGQNRPRKIGGLRLSIAEGVLPPEFIGPPDPSTVNQKPVVIEAPQLPIQ